jgi:hypothetical protein
MKNRLVLLFAMFALTCMVALGADITGKWVSDGGGKGGPQTFNLKQSGATLTGTVETQRGSADISNGKVDGDKVSFEVTRDMGDKGKFTTKYSGTAGSGSTMTLSADNGRGPRDITLTKQ